MQLASYLSTIDIFANQGQNSLKTYLVVHSKYQKKNFYFIMQLIIERNSIYIIKLAKVNGNLPSNYFHF